MTTVKRIFTMTVLAGINACLTPCLAQKKMTMETNTTVKKVAYADKILLHMHPEKVLSYLPDLTDGQIASLYGMTLTEYTDAKTVYDNQAKQVATDLLLDNEFASKVAMLPFKKADTILILGESTTDALNSWAYILTHLLAQKRPQDSIKITNAVISGQTTTEALSRITAQVKLNPDWVIVNLGANDCIRFGSEANKTTVSFSETINNLTTIRDIITGNTKANVVWIAPVPVDEEKARRFPPFQANRLFLKNADIMAIADTLNDSTDNVIDLRNDFGTPAKDEFVQFDGVHLSLEGQKAVAVALINNFIKSN